MNQLATLDPRANLELARAFADSKMVPEHFKKSVGDCYIAINLAHRYGMEPWMLMQEMYIIQGRPMMSGKLATAILNNSLAEPLRPTYAGKDDDREITLTGRPEGSAPLSVTLKVKDAKTANEQWKKNPDQMLMYAAARMWGRRYTPDLILGIVFDDEEITSGATLVPSAPTTPIAGPQPTSADAPFDPHTGEVGVVARGPDEKWYDWGARLVTTIRKAHDIDTIDQWLAANAETLALCQKESAKVAGNIATAVTQYKLDLVRREDSAT
jgi:hypothetical protein